MRFPPAFGVALRCLVHPASVAAIATLVVNDHLLKPALGTAVTGKLSDVAGLFFFPFLLALVIAPLFRRTRAAGLAAISLTALVFAAIKLSPAANDLLTTIVSSMLGAAAAFILDPTDLLALVALVPAWLLWRHTERHAAGLPSRRAAVPVVLAAALATMATPPIREEAGVIAIVVEDGRLFATVGGPSGVFESTDGGRTWSVTPRARSLSARVDTLWRRMNELGQQARLAEEEHRRLQFQQLPDEGLNAAARSLKRRMADSLEGARLRIDSLRAAEAELARNLAVFGGPNRVEPPDSLVAIDPRQPSVIYRAAFASSRIERSIDGGRSWSVDWADAEGRHEYLRRHLEKGSRHRGYGVLDMDFAPGANGTLVVAFDGEGVLVRDPDGDWSQHVVGALVPATASARSLGDVLETLMYEWFVLLLAAIVAGLVINAVAWRRVPASHEPGVAPGPGRSRYVWLPVTVLVVGPLALGSSPILGPIVPIVLGLPVGLAYVALVIGDWASMAARPSAVARVIARRAQNATLTAGVLPTLVMIAWALGVIVDYTAAVTAAVIAWLAGILWGVRPAPPTGD